MKRIIIIILILLNNPIYSQTEDWILKQKMDWNDYPDQISKKEKNRIVDSLMINSDFKEFSAGNIMNSSFHFLDINMDSKSDIIYCGFAGAESDRTIIFLNQNGKYIQITDYFGHVFDLELTNGLLKHLFIANYSCCAGYLTHYEKYKFQGSKKKFELKEKIAILNRTELPPFKPISKKFITIKEKYRLRSEPIIDNTVYETSARSFEALGNIIAEYNKDSEGLAIAKSIDSTDRIWWFVIMDDSNQPDNSIFYQGDNNRSPYKIGGWMSSRYTKEK